MRNISLSSIISKNSVATDVPWLVALKIDVVNPSSKVVVDTFHLVANNEDITLAGQLYVATKFDINVEESQDQLPSVSVSIVDMTQTIHKYLQEYKGGNGSHVTVYIFAAPSTVIEQTDVEYTFDVISANADSDTFVVTWELGSENPLTLPIPARKQMRDRCQWRYKSSECGYAGALPTCDLSLSGTNGCTAHANQSRFGGFTGINVRNI